MSRVWKAVGVRTDPAEERSPLEHLMQNSRLILAFAFGVCLIAATYIYDPSLVTGMVSPTTDSLDSAPYLSRPQDNPSNTALFSSRAAFILRKLTDAPQAAPKAPITAPATHLMDSAHVETQVVTLVPLEVPKVAPLGGSRRLTCISLGHDVPHRSPQGCSPRRVTEAHLHLLGA
ncbi:hypothetical protein CYMTET_12444 [Cymbomonas tetramitiformis]|uniref:Transmembrane protein n=1 Tax=Cymbomonas tetramitiformis TaxID=36881 RepID=A0AAE0GKL6_9CHLO|nr:hypothetical protein CYMTET_12444 [Cymbomonas tetramitiformis]